MTTRAAIVSAARAWLNTRWQHQASLRGVGTDCIGLIVGVARELDLPEAAQFDARADVKGYGRQPDPGMLLSACGELLAPCIDPVPGDILLFRFERDPQHFGILTRADYFIHAYAQARRVVENRLDQLWRSRIVGAYSFRGVG